MDEYDDGPYWVILLMYGSHDMRHTGFRRLTVVNGTLGFWGVTILIHNFCNTFTYLLSSVDHLLGSIHVLSSLLI